MPMINGISKLPDLLDTQRIGNSKSWKRFNRFRRTMLFVSHLTLTVNCSSQLSVTGSCFYVCFQPRDNVVVVVKNRETTENLLVRIQQELAPLFYDGFYLFSKSLI